MSDTTLIQRLRTAWTYCRVEQVLRFEAADALEQQAAKIEQLKLAEEGAKTAFFHVVQDKDDIAAECKRTHELLHSAHDIIRRDAAKIEALRVQVKQSDERGDEALRRAHAGEAEVEALRAYAERLNWLHSPNSNDVDGYEWGIYRVKWAGGKPVEIWQTLSDFSDLDAALRQEQPT